MTNSDTAPRIAVVGGGILGVSTAVHLLRRGASVLLMTEAELASEATGRSLSWLNSAGERSEEYHRLRLAGIDRYRTLFHTGLSSQPDQDWLRFDGGLYWASPGSRKRTEERHASERSHGYDSQLLEPTEVPARAPGVNEDAIPENAIFNAGEGWVSLPHLLDFLMAEFKERGGDLVTDAGKASLMVEDGRTVGVRTTGGEQYFADSVLLACGAATPEVLAEQGVLVGDASPVSMLVLTEAVDQAPAAVLNTPRAAMRPNPGGTVALDHDWYEEQIVENADGSFSIAAEVVQELADEAAKLIEGQPALTPESYKIGRKPIPGDGEPVLGEVEALPGCFVAFTHSGATLALVVGELLAGEILTGERSPLLATFRPERFTA